MRFGFISIIFSFAATSAFASSNPPKPPASAPLASCADVRSSPLASTGDSVRTWYHVTTPKGYALMIHGLNTKPTKMQGIADMLNANGIEVLGIGLTGHTGNIETFKSVTQDQWIEDALMGYCEARDAADQAHLPLVFAGYSLGGALGVDIMTSQTSAFIHFDQMILFAPAISIHTRCYLLQVAGIAGKSTIIPSMNNVDYRANADGTSMAAYESLFDIISDIGDRDLSKANIPTTLFIDPDDELVSESGIQDMISSQKLTNWKIQEVSNEQTSLKPSYHHLIIDSACIGDAAWTKVTATLSDSINSSRLSK